MQATDPTAAPPNPEVIYAMLTAHQQTAALNAAIDLNLFAALSNGPADVDAIADSCSASPKGIRVLCDFLVIHGLLQKNGALYSHTPTSGVFLDPASPACMASMAQFLSNSAIQQTYKDLPQIVRSGRTTLPGAGSVEPENPMWVSFAENMAPMTGPLAKPMAALLLKELSGPIRVLDIAAGHGLFGIEIAKQNPEARITAVDWAQVLDVASRNAKAAGVADRFTRLPGSAFDVDFGGPYDAVLLTNFLHHFDQPTCIGLLKKIRAALRPGGIAETLEFVPDESRVSPRAPASFAMTMLTTTAAGDAYTFSELQAMYSNAGFSNITSHPVPMGPQTIVIGHA